MYKVVKNLDGILTSVVPLPESGLCLTYKVGEYTYPAEGTNGLFVFGNLRDAQRFSCSFYDKIFECEVTNPKKTEYYYDIEMAYTFWKHMKKGRLSRSLIINLHADVYLCESVKLLKEVDRR